MNADPVFLPGKAEFESKQHISFLEIPRFAFFFQLPLCIVL